MQRQIKRIHEEEGNETDELKFPNKTNDNTVP
jgi:hypothetical protein